jgi:hypothetical protein
MTIPPMPPGWNKTLDDLFDELAAGARDSIGSPEGDWARAYQLSLLSADTRFPHPGDVYEAREDMDIDYMTSWAAPFTGGGEACLRRVDRLQVTSVAVGERPISAYLQAVDYDEMEQRIVPQAERDARDYTGFYFSIRTRDLNEQFRLVTAA